MRLIVQSLETGRFLAPGEDGQPEWMLSLVRASGGIVDDPERAFQLAQDWAEHGESVEIVDLDSLE